MRVLVLNGYSRNSLSIIRSLGSKSFTVDIVIDKSSISGYNERKFQYKSKYVNDVFNIEKGNKEIESLLNILKKKSYNFLFAGGTRQSNLISKYKSEFEKYTKVVSEDYSKILTLHEKKRCVDFVKNISIPVPKTFFAKNKIELIKICNELNGNAIVKHSDSYSSKGLRIYRGTSTEMIEDYIQNFGFNYKSDEFPLIQQLIEGELYDTTAFAVNGKTKGVLSQKRVMPETFVTGSGIINKTTFNPEIIEYTKKILKEISWNGHIEIDWIREKETGNFYFIEVNPKFWGTNQLTISAGFDFPFWNVLMLKGEEVPELKTYKVGLTYRWLELEIITIAKYSKGIGHFKNWVVFLTRFFRGNTSTSKFKGDERPFWGEISEAFLYILRIYYSRLKSFDL